MGVRKGPRSMRPARTVEGRENQLISLADQLAEKRLRDGTASAQEIVYFLKAGSTREKLEKARLENENLLLSAKYEQINSGQRMEELYVEAIKAMKHYSGEQDDHDEG